MKYRYLGNSGLKVSEVCLGTMTFDSRAMFEDYGSTDIKKSKELVDYAIDNGINLFDTADSYSGGHAEEVLGKVLGNKRKDVLISTKLGFPISGKNPNDGGLSRKHIIEGCENSLKRLGTDYIDVLLMHRHDPLTSMEVTLSALTELVKQGKVRYIGCSNFAAWEVMKSLSVSEKYGFEKYVTYQAYYSLGSREVENDIIPVCGDQGLGVTCWSPLSGGFFTGKYRRGEPKPKEGRRVDPDNVTNKFAPVDEEKGYDTVEVLDEVANKHGTTIPQISLAFLLANQVVSSVVVGSKKITHLEDNIGSSDIELDGEDIEKISKASEPFYSYPHWFKKAIWEKDGIRV